MSLTRKEQTMSRYVDIEGDWVDDALKVYSLGYYDDDEYAIPFEALGSAPSIDIVRCSECRYWHSGECWGIPYRGDYDTSIDTKADDFCSYGEREGE